MARTTITKVSAKMNRYDELKKVAAEFALIQMKAETLNEIDSALDRLQEGTYGNCFVWRRNRQGTPSSPSLRCAMQEL